MDGPVALFSSLPHLRRSPFPILAVIPFTLNQSVSLLVVLSGRLLRAVQLELLATETATRRSPQGFATIKNRVSSCVDSHLAQRSFLHFQSDVGKPYNS